MKVFIIAEGSKNTGFGHITRCLSLYQAFEEKYLKVYSIKNGNIYYKNKIIKYLTELKERYL